MGTRKGGVGAWPPSHSRPSTSPGAPPRARSRRTTSRPSRRSCARKGLIVLDIEEQTPANAGDILARFRSVKADELVIATRQLATMVSRACRSCARSTCIEEQTENDKLQRDLDRGPQGRRGRPLAVGRARASTRTIFNDLYVAMVQAGETGGILDETLLRVADQLEKDAALRRQIKAAMIYPSLIGGFALRRAVRAGRLPRAGVREDLQGLRRRAARDHEVHRRASRT